MTSQELELLFKKMLKEQEEVTKQDEIYLEDIKDFSLKVNWDIMGVTGYQIFEEDNYSYKFGEGLDDPDMTLTINDLEHARKFLSGERLHYTHVRDKDYKGIIKYDVVSEETITTDEGKKKIMRTRKPFFTARFDEDESYNPFFLGKLPIFRKLRGDTSREVMEKFYGSYIPINKSLGTFENQVIPYKVFKHFIDRADGIVLQDICGCRLINECEHHPVSIGCMQIGSEMKNRDLEDLEPDLEENIPGRFTTKEEALERVRLAIEGGLIPILGSINPSGHLISMCFCCSCCCVNGKMITHGPSSPTIFKRIEGLTVEVDPDVCVGCGDCLEVCVFKGMEMIDDKARVNQNRCLGCGRCEMACPNEAISIEFDDSKRVKGLIDTLESYADVS
jgi:UDP-glucose 4-epimerase